MIVFGFRKRGKEKKRSNKQKRPLHRYNNNNNFIDLTLDRN